MRKDGKMTESLLMSTLDQEMLQLSSDLGPWLESSHRTIDQPRRPSFTRLYQPNRNHKKEATAIKLPLIVNKTLLFNLAVDESNLQWHPRTKRRVEGGEGRTSVLVSRSMDYRSNPSPPSLEMLSIRKRRKQTDLCVKGIPTTYLC